MTLRFLKYRYQLCVQYFRNILSNNTDLFSAYKSGRFSSHHLCYYAAALAVEWNFKSKVHSPRKFRIDGREFSFVQCTISGTERENEIRVMATVSEFRLLHFRLSRVLHAMWYRLTRFPFVVGARARVHIRVENCGITQAWNFARGVSKDNFTCQ